MADPRQELADIIAPAAPVMAAPAGNDLLVWAAGGLIAVAALGLIAWLRHRRRPARVLHAIARAAAQQQASLPVLAARLDAWARTFFRLARVDAAMCPPTLNPAVWSDWVRALERLRFAPSASDGYVVLASLCEHARGWRRHA